MKKRLTWVLAGAASVLAVLQLFNPSRNNPPVKRDFAAAAGPPPDVAAAIRAACYDCHSHETTWPFYARVAPVSWLIASDVNAGRKHLNFSEWPEEPLAARQTARLVNEVVDYKEMPPEKIYAAPRRRPPDGRRSQGNHGLDRSRRRQAPQRHQQLSNAPYKIHPRNQHRVPANLRGSPWLGRFH